MKEMKDQDFNPNLHNFFQCGFCDSYWPTTKVPEAAAGESAQALALLGARSGHILDWRGGWGSHSLYFAKQGFRVTLLDFCERYIEMAKETFAKAEVEFTPVLADCRETPSEIQADFAVCMGNSVGFLPEEEEIKAFASLRAALRPGAKVLLDCMNLFFLRDTLLKGRNDTSTDGTIRRASQDFDFETNTTHSVFEMTDPAGNVTREKFTQTLYTPCSLAQLVTKAGFEGERICGDYEGNPISFTSRKIVLLAHC